MKKNWQSGAGVILGALAFVAVVATPLARAPQAADPNVTVDPSILSTMQFRHLSVFSRGGRSTAVAGVPSNPSLFYMGSTGGGVWQTNDSGVSWRNISDGFFEAGSIGAIDVSLSDPNVIYVGTGSACPRGNVSPGVGMYKSTDAGKTWSHIGLRSAGTIGRVRIHPTNPNLVYVAVLGNLFAPSKERGVYRSKDGGATWEQVHAISDRTGAVDLTMDPKNPDVLIAAMWTTERKPWTIESGSTEGGMFRTTNGGDTWTKLGGGLPDKVMVGRIGVAISGADPKRVYAQVEAGNDLGGVYISNDGGITWTPGFKGRAQQQRAWYYTTSWQTPWMWTRSTVSMSARRSPRTAARRSAMRASTRIATTTTCGSTRPTTKSSSSAMTAAAPSPPGRVGRSRRISQRRRSTG